MKNTDKMIEVKNVSMRFNMTGDKINNAAVFCPACQRQN